MNSNSLEDSMNEIYNNQNKVYNEAQKYDPYEMDINFKGNINYMLPKGGQAGEVEMEDVGNLCDDTIKPRIFNKEENRNEKNETNITNKTKINDDTNIKFDIFFNDSRSEEIMSLNENDSQNDNSFEVNTLCEKNIFQENQILPIKTIDGKPHFLDLNRGLLIMINQDKEDQIYKEIFDNSHFSKEYEDDWNQIYDDIYYMKPLINLEPFNHSTFQQKYKNNINSEENYQYFSLKEIVNTYGVFFINLYQNIFKNKEELVNMENFGICKNIADYLKDSAPNPPNPEDKANKKIEDNTHQVIIKQESEENLIKKKNIRKKDRDKMMIKILTKLESSIRKATNSFEEFKIRKIQIIKPKIINEILDAYFIFEYLRQYLYNILSNESSKDTNIKSNKSIIEEIIKENNNNEEVIKHLSLTVQKCLDYFRYKEKNDKFKYKLVDFLIKEFKFQTQKKKETISFSKEYIASLLLLTYNFERFFQIKKKIQEIRIRNILLKN